MSKLSKLQSMTLRLMGAMTALIICTLGFVAYTTYQTKAKQEAKVSDDVENYALLLDQSIQSAVQKIDLSLRSSVKQLEGTLARNGRLNAKDVNALLTEQHDWLGSVAAFRVTDTTGLVKYGLGSAPANAASYGDRAFFHAQRDFPSSGMRTSHAMQGPFSTTWYVVFSRRFNHPNGAFAGVVVAAVPLSYFTELLSKLNLGPHGVAMLRDDHGGMLARFPTSTDPSARVGSKHMSKELTRIFASGAPSVTFHTFSTVDGVERTLSYRALDGVPFRVVVGIGVADYLADWRTHAHMSAIGAAVFVVLTVLFSWGLLRSFAKSDGARRQSEQHLAERDLALTHLESQTRLLSDSRDRVQLATESAGVGIWEAHLASGVLMWDAQQSRLYGDKPVEITGNYAMWAKRVHPEDLPRVEAEHAIAIAGAKRFMVDFRIVWPDGTLHCIRSLGQPRLDASGAVTGMVGTSMDVTDALLSAQTLKDARDKAEAATISKSLFLATMSHEIRTPMNAVLGLLQILAQSDLSANQRDYIEKIDGAAHSLMGLLNDILDFSKMEADKLDLDPQPFQTDAFMRELAVVLAAYVGNNAIEVLFDMDPQLPETLVGDALRLKQVLVNLGGNAIKFTSAGQVVVGMKLLHSAHGMSEIAFFVQDTGIGISQENIPKLFSSFSQAESNTTRRFGGTGLGLSICKNLIELMGGHIQVDSTVGTGSTFSFTLTLATPCGAEGTPTTIGQAYTALANTNTNTNTNGTGTGATASTLMLVVDDNPVACALLRTAMQAVGWTVDVATHGAQALDMIEKRARSNTCYGVVCLDSQLATMDGWEVIKQFDARRSGCCGECAGVPPRFIMLSSNGRDRLELRTSSEQARIAGFLTKPVTPAMLIGAAQGTTAATSAPRRVGRSNKRELTGLHILVVEDNAINQKIAEELLSAQGAEVSIAADGRQGVNAVASAKRQYDVVLMDIQMPVMDGYQATMVIRNTLGLDRLPIIGLTANAMVSDREKCLAAGMNDHLGKPYEFDQLIACVLRHARAHAAPSTASTALAEDVALQSALARMGGNTGIYTHAARQFAAALPGMLVELSALVAAGDEDGVRRCAHTGKGNAATLGLERLSAALRTLEDACKSGAKANAQAKSVEALRPLVDVAVDALHQAIASLPVPREAPSAVSVPSTARQQSDALQRLIPALEAADMSALEIFIQERETLKDLLQDDFTAVDEAMNNLNFQQALGHCRPFSAALRSPP